MCLTDASFPALSAATSTCFPLLSTCYVFFGAFRRLRVFPCFSSLTCFPALSIGYLSLHAFRLLVFPTLSVSYLFPRPLHRLPAFACFSTTSVYVSRAFRQLHIFPRFPSVTHLLALSVGY